jgi:hypothetical protein
MLLRMLNNDGQSASKASIPVAMALLAVGLVLLGVALGWRVILPGYQAGSTSHFLRGFLIGLAIALEIWAFVIAFTAARRRKTGAS